MSLKKSVRALWFSGAVFFAAALGAGVFLSIRGFEHVLAAKEVPSFGEGPAQVIKKEGKKLTLRDFEVIYKNPAVAEPAAPPVTEIEREPEPANEGALGFSLLMTIIWPDPERSVAVIVDSAKKQEVKEVGDFFKEAEFLEIRDGEVELLFRGKNVVLKVPEKKLDELLTAEAAPQVSPIKRIEMVRQMKPAVVSPGYEPSSASNPSEFTRGEFEEMVKRIPQILQEFKYMHHRDEDGSVDGLQILSIQPDSVLTKWGLRDGDVIMEVNGEAVTNIQQVIRLIQQVRQDEDDFFDITVERGGEEEFLEFDIND